MAATNSRYHALERVAFAKGGAFGGPGTGKSVLWALCIIAMYRLFKIKKPVLIFDSDRGAGYLQPMFKYAGIEVQVNDTDFSLKALNEDMKYAGKECGAFLADSIADPWEEVMRAYLKTNGEGKQYIDIADWPLLFNEWTYQFDVPFKSMPCHGFWTSKPKAVYENLVDQEASKRKGYEVKKNQKVDETATGGKSRSAEFGPGLTLELYHVIENGCTIREARVTKDRFMMLNGNSFRWSEPVVKGGEIDYEMLVDKNLTFQALLPHFRNVMPDAKHHEIDMETRSGVFFSGASSNNADESFFFERVRLTEDMQNLLTRRFPSTSGPEKAAKLAIPQWMFDTTVWESVQKNYPVDFLRRAVTSLRVILSDDTIIDGILKWNGVAKRDTALVAKIKEATNAVIKATQTEGRENSVPMDAEPEVVDTKPEKVLDLWPELKAEKADNFNSAFAQTAIPAEVATPAPKATRKRKMRTPVAGGQMDAVSHDAQLV